MAISMEHAQACMQSIRIVLKFTLKIKCKMNTEQVLWRNKIERKIGIDGIIEFKNLV